MLVEIKRSIAIVEEKKEPLINGRFALPYDINSLQQVVVVSIHSLMTKEKAWLPRYAPIVLLVVDRAQ